MDDARKTVAPGIRKAENGLNCDASSAHALFCDAQATQGAMRAGT
jgi:hypothetical protein